MTYNFDPDKWFENELSVLSSKFRKSEMTLPEYESAVEKLELQCEKMWDRLDGSYQIPEGNDLEP